MDSLLTLCTELFESTGMNLWSLKLLSTNNCVSRVAGPWAVRNVVPLELRREIVEALATLRYINEVGEQRAGALLSVIQQSVQVILVDGGVCFVSDCGNSVCEP